MCTIMYMHAGSQSEEDKHRQVEIDGEDYPWSVSPPAKKIKAEAGPAEREKRGKIHRNRLLGLQIQGALIGHHMSNNNNTNQLTCKPRNSEHF